MAHVFGFIDAPSTSFDISLDVRGTVLQRQVWEALRKIPTGSTLSYAALADDIGRPTAVRAVAQACGSNTLAVAIPCHRVVQSEDDLSEYRRCAERKRALLNRVAA